MPWANLDDKFPTHPKVLPVSDAAFRLHVTGICYCAEHQTDGVLGSDVVPLLVPRFRSRTLEELLARGLWLPHAAGYEIHDYLEWNRSRDQIAAERERKSKAGRKGAEKRWS